MPELAHQDGGQVTQVRGVGAVEGGGGHAPQRYRKLPVVPRDPRPPAVNRDLVVSGRGLVLR
jgi:hypothetical protein